MPNYPSTAVDINNPILYGHPKLPSLEIKVVTLRQRKVGRPDKIEQLGGER